MHPISVKQFDDRPGANHIRLDHRSAVRSDDGLCIA